MKTIWKFQLAITDAQCIDMPEGAEILTAQFQSGALCLWALVDSLNQKRPRTIEIFGTGNPISEFIGTRRFIATAQMPNLPLVWHLFESIL